MKTPIKTLVARRRKALKAAKPKSRDRLRHKLKVALKLKELAA